ncbi:MAG TPA: RdgB/HAM1 family non-canonical purine NTP pyrophosphatase [Methylomirabilota bacterium]|nr:RdgB/HAM1 family non-canonical purine NTP pyrophosphatase [Methylomirabilota bacterium]
MPNASSGSRPVLVLATGNPGKAGELRALLTDIPFEIRTLADYLPFTMPEEMGTTYEANALLKARAAAAHTGQLALGDDSGIEVHALGGAPGVRSARFGGPGLDDRGRVRHLLRQIEHVPDARRGARFVCVIALVGPDGRETVVAGACDGRLTREPRGTKGFGYDPIFFYEPFDATFGEVSDARKATVSHRGRAAAAARAALIARV